MAGVVWGAVEMVSDHVGHIPTAEMQVCLHLYQNSHPSPWYPLHLSRSDHPQEPSKTPGIYGSYLFEWWASSSHIKEEKLSSTELKGRSVIKFDR